MKNFYSSGDEKMSNDSATRIGFLGIGLGYWALLGYLIVAIMGITSGDWLQIILFIPVAFLLFFLDDKILKELLGITIF